jgi:hypothetical protein
VTHTTLPLLDQMEAITDCWWNPAHLSAFRWLLIFQGEEKIHKGFELEIE